MFYVILLLFVVLSMASSMSNSTKKRNITHSAAYNVTDVEDIKQFPFMVALLTDNKEFICSGSVLEQRLVISASHCLIPSLTYIMLNSTTINGKHAVYVKVKKTEAYPTFSKSNLKKNIKDVGIIITNSFSVAIAKRVIVKTYEDTRIIQNFIAIGYGLNTESEKESKLQYVTLTHRYIYDLGETFKGFTDADVSVVPACFKDTGGPALVDGEMAGIVVMGQKTCSVIANIEYAVNKLMVDILPSFLFNNWAQKNIREIQEKVLTEEKANFLLKPLAKSLSKTSGSVILQKDLVTLLKCLLPTGIVYFCL